MIFRTLISTLAMGTFLMGSQALAQGSETYVGVGITIQEGKLKDGDKKEKVFVIIDMIKNAPAQRSGIQVNDLIRAVDGKSTAGQKLKTVSQWIAGDAGTSVTLTVQTAQSSPRDVTLTREEITYECFMKGWVHLTYYGDRNGGNFSGTIENQRVNFNVVGSRASGYFKNKYLSLNAVLDFNNAVELNGWIGSSYVSWRGNANNISVYQSCVK
jgi:hypothetical protein